MSGTDKYYVVPRAPRRGLKNIAEKRDTLNRLGTIILVDVSIVFDL